MAKRNPITGLRFGRIVIIRDGSPRVVALCDCGKEFTPMKGMVVIGHTTSCGCGRRGQHSHFWKHGMAKTPEYMTWNAMMQRCFSPKSKAYPKYGGRGISVCERWLDFNNFYADMGPRPDGLSLDRIDNNRGYEPENCRWATRAAQNDNRSISYRYILDGVVFRTQKEVAKALGMSPAYVNKISRQPNCPFVMEPLYK